MSAENDLTKIAKQEELLVFSEFAETTAWEIGRRLRDAAVKKALPVEIEISVGGHCIFACALAGTSPNNSNWIRRKRNTVLHFHKSSYAINRQLEKEGADLERKFALPQIDYVAAGGGFPIRVRSAGVIGVIVVSGLPQRDDHQLVVTILADYLGIDPALVALD